MMIERIFISSVHVPIDTRPLPVAAVAWVWLDAVLGTVDFSKSSGPPADSVITHLSPLNFISPTNPPH